jgi:hypothetical protein
MNDELERMWKEAVVAQFKTSLLSRKKYLSISDTKII